MSIPQILVTPDETLTLETQTQFLLDEEICISPSDTYYSTQAQAASPLSPLLGSLDDPSPLEGIFSLHSLPPTCPPNDSQLGTSSAHAGPSQSLILDQDPSSRPGGWDEWMDQLKDTYREPAEDASSLIDDAASACHTSPLSGPYSPHNSPHSTVPSSPSLYDLGSQLDSLNVTNSPDGFLQPRLDETSHPNSPNMLHAGLPSIQRSQSMRIPGHRSNHSFNGVGEYENTAFLSAGFGRGRSRHRSNTAPNSPNSRKSSPYLYPYEPSPSRTRTKAHHIRSASDYTYSIPQQAFPHHRGHRRDSSIPALQLDPLSTSPHSIHESPSGSLTIDTQLVQDDHTASLFMHMNHSTPGDLASTSTTGLGLFDTDMAFSGGFDPTVYDYSTLASSPISLSATTSTSVGTTSTVNGMPVPINKKIVTTEKTRKASEGKRKHEQKHECHICSERFTTKNKRDRHVDAHSGIKRFPCEREGCTKAFTSAADRKRHQTNSRHP